MGKMEKECICCKLIKPISEYYKHSQMKDGTLNKCKECQKANSKKTRDKNIDRYREYDRIRSTLPHRVKARADYQKTDAFRASHKKSLLKSAEKFPLKKKARYIFSNAIRDGKVNKLPCFICGDKIVEGHHPDYSRPLEVVWLCTKHHSQVHKEFWQMERNRKVQHESKS